VTGGQNGCQRPHGAGPLPALAILGTLESDERLAGNHRVDAVRAHLLEMAGDTHGARIAYLAAARLTHSLPEQSYLVGRAARLAPLAGPVSSSTRPIPVD
jgi:predicted RNA polymerase sigma factor